ncbi:MAG: ADOP family duplicated permease [Terriglobales bacterium]
MGKLRRLGNILRGRRLDRDLQAELDAHLALRAEANRAAGLAPEAAGRDAARRLGNDLLLRERTRDADVLRWLDELRRDLALALRGLRRNPGFAAVAVATLGLGIGASAAIFTVVDAVALRPLPFEQPQQLVSLLETSREFPVMSLSWPEYLDWRARNHVFSQLAGLRGSDMILTHAGTPAFVIGQRVTANYFSMLGAKPELGRTFLPGEDGAGAPDVVVVSDGFYRSRLGGDPSWLGKGIELDARVRTVIGVMPPSFAGVLPSSQGVEDWTPLGAYAAQNPSMQSRGRHAGILGVGRLRSGVSLAQARTDLAGISAQLAQQYPATEAGITASLQRFLDLIVGDLRPGLMALLAAVGLLLLIACANVANLLLARAAAARQADAVRTALGASRLRLLRQHLAESLCLGVLGGGAGLLLAKGLVSAAGASVAATLPRAGNLTLDGQVLGFTLGLALLTTLLCGLAPAWQAARRAPAPALQQGGWGLAGGGHRLRGILVAAETALALVLLIGAGLLVRSLTRLEAVDRGFDPDRTLSFIIGLPESKYPGRAQEREFFRQTAERLERLPGVQAAGGIYPLPFSGNDWEEGFTIVGRPAPASGQTPATDLANVRGQYFQAMGMRLLHGREFTENDTGAAPPVAIVDDSFARRFFSGPDALAAALGQRIVLDGKVRTIVGVVGHVMNSGLNGSSGPDVMVQTFIPQEQSDLNVGALSFVVRSRTGDPMRLLTAAVAQVNAVDPDQPVDDIKTMDQRIALSLAQRRLTLWLMGVFALLALALAAIGIYGVLNYAVAQRRHEIGVRMALGAGRGRVLAEVLGQGMRLALIGAACGLAGALALGRFGRAFLFGVSAADPLTLAAAPALLLAIAALACCLPARRATRVDPVIALRGE